MTKIVINGCYGGFGLSKAACDVLNAMGRRDSEGDLIDSHTFSYEGRDDADLVEVVETMGKAASGEYASLHIVEIPDDVKWSISEYDGIEHVCEQHRTWR